LIDEVTNGKALIHYSRYRLMVSVTTWLRACMRQPMTNGLAQPSVWQKLNSISSVQFSYVALYAHVRANLQSQNLHQTSNRRETCCNRF